MKRPACGPAARPRAGQAMAAGYDVVVQTLLIQQQ
jgi:hypothetical protein